MVDSPEPQAPMGKGLASTGHFVGLASLGLPSVVVYGPHRPGVPRESASPPLPLGGLRLCVAPWVWETSSALDSSIFYPRFFTSSPPRLTYHRLFPSSNAFLTKACYNEVL